MAMHLYFRRRLANRLRLIEALRQDPSLAEVPVAAPLVVVGFYRSGTTLLHNLLSFDDDHRAPRTWEMWYPAPYYDNERLDRARRRAQTGAYLALSRALVPDQRQVHFITADSPEECLFLLEHAMVNSMAPISFVTFDYARRLLDDDLDDAYALHKRQLQLLTDRAAPMPWVLKCPYHTWHLDALLRTYPDARVVYTHRNVVQSLGSSCSLTSVMARPMAHALDETEIGAFWSEHYRAALDRVARVRERVDPARICDVRYPDLMADPVGTVRRVYKHFGMRWRPMVRQRIEEHLERHPKDVHGVHEYTLGEFGLTEGGVRERFGDYHRAYDL